MSSIQGVSHAAAPAQIMAARPQQAASAPSAGSKTQAADSFRASGGESPKAVTYSAKGQGGDKDHDGDSA